MFIDEFRRRFGLDRFEMAEIAGVSGPSISRRCMRMIQQEFAATGFTFRYADEWDSMNGWQRRADLSRRRYNTKN